MQVPVEKSKEIHDLRPWRRIERRPSRRIMVGDVPVGGGAPIAVQTMTNTPTTDVSKTVEQIEECAEAGGGHRPRVVPGSRLDRRVPRDRQAKPGSARRGHPLPLPKSHRGGGCRCCVSQDQSGKHRIERTRGRSGAGGNRQRVFDSDRSQRGFARTPSAGKIRRTLSRGDGRERPQSNPVARRCRLYRIQDFGQGLRRVSRLRRLSATRRSDRCAAPHRHHRIRQSQVRHRSLVHRVGQSPVVRHRRHAPGCRSRPIRSKRSRLATKS